MCRRLAAVVVVAVAASFLVTGSVAADSHADRTAIGITVRGNLVDTDSNQANRVPSTYLESVQDVVVYEEDGKRFAATASSNEGPHLLDITDVNSIKPMPQPFNNAPLRPSNGGANGIDTWVANDGNRYFAVAWGSSDALQIFALHSSGVLWGNWSNGSIKYIIDSDRLDVAKDVFVYTLQETCQSKACEVFPGLFVSRGDPIYKQYAVVAAIGKVGQGGSFTGSEVHIYDVTNPNALCSCSSGSGQTALLKSSIKDTGSLELLGAAGLTYYQQGGKHYALVSAESDDGVQIIDITDPENPVAHDSLSDTTSLQLASTSESAVYSVGGRLYAVAVGTNDDGIQIVDVTDPTDITAAGKLADTGSLLLEEPKGVTVHSIGGLHYAIVASLHDDGIQIVDVTDPDNPVAKANLAHTSGRLLDGAYGVDTFSDGGRHYAIVAAAGSNGVQIVELTTVTADAGNDVSVPSGSAQVTLDGTGSTVSSGATPTYQWTQTGGGTVTLSGATTAQPSFVPPTSVGTALTFRVTATHAGASASDTVTLTVGAAGSSVTSLGGVFSGDAVQTETVTKPDGGTETYLSMRFTGDDESQVIGYRLASQPSGNVTVEVLKMVQNEPYGAVGYNWDFSAVSVSPSTLTFTASNWDEPQAVIITSQTDADRNAEQVILVFASSASGPYSGIHVLVDDPAPHGGSPGTEGELGILKIPEDVTLQEQTQETLNGQPAGDGNVGVAEPTTDTDTDDEDTLPPPTRTTVPRTTPRSTGDGPTGGGGPAGGGRSTTTADTTTGDGSMTGGVERLARGAASRFVDVDVGDYYAAPVGWMVLHDITRGCDVESFCVGVSTSRKHFVTFLWRAAGQPTPRQFGSVVFDDVATGGYTDNATGWAFEQGITVGCDINENERLFCPNKVVTRAQIATLLYRYTGVSADPENVFTDVDTVSYYSSAVTWMHTHRITTGCTQNGDNPKFCPNQPATRAQVATLLYRVATTPTSWGTKGGILKTNR